MRQRIADATDRRIAAISHLSICFGIFVSVGFTVGLAINAVIWLRSRNSPIVSFHAAQAGTYQLIVLVINIILLVTWVAGVLFLLGGSQVGEGMLSGRQMVMGLWLALLPIGIIWFFAAILFGVYGGIKVALGREFTYPIIGAWISRRMANRNR